MPLSSTENINRSIELRNIIHQILSEFIPHINDKYSTHLAFRVLRGEQNCEFYASFITQYGDVMKAIELLSECDLMIVDVSKSLDKLRKALQKHSWVIQEFRVSRESKSSSTKSNPIKKYLGDLMAKFVIPELYDGIRFINRDMKYWKSVDSKYGIVAEIYNGVFPQEKNKTEDNIKKILQRSNYADVADTNFRKQMSIAAQNKKQSIKGKFERLLDVIEFDIREYYERRIAEGATRKEILIELEELKNGNRLMFASFTSGLEREIELASNAIFHITSNVPLRKRDKPKH